MTDRPPEATDDHHHRDRWRPRCRSAASARCGPSRHGRTLAWRALVRIQRNPEQLLDVTLQPIIFVTLFVFLFGGAHRRHEPAPVPAVRAARDHGADGDLREHRHRHRPEHRHHEGHLRPVPQHADRPVGAAVRRDRRRHLPLRRVARRAASRTARCSASGSRPTCGCALAGVARAHRVRVRAVLDLGAARPVRQVAAERAGLRVHHHVPADVRQQRVRHDRHAAGLAAGVGQGQPGDRADRRDARV